MPALAAVTALPIALAFMLATAAFATLTALMIHVQRCAEGRESPLEAEFWDARQHSGRDAGHARSKRTRHSAGRSLPRIGLVTHDRHDLCEYALPDAYALGGAATQEPMGPTTPVFTSLNTRIIADESAEEIRDLPRWWRERVAG